MFENIGSKIKNFAKIWCWLVIIGSIVAWIILGGDWGLDEWLPWIVLLSGLAIIPSAWLMYGFGQLVEDTHNISDEISDKANRTVTETNDELPEL